MIELSSQAIVLSNYFRLVSFDAQIVAWAAGAAVFRLLSPLSAPNRATEAAFSRQKCGPEMIGEDRVFALKLSGRFES